MKSTPRQPWSLVALAFALPLVFAAITNHAWEDFFITLRSSRNLVEGHGLVFNPGERVHTFTSPLGVLVPAACLALTGGKSAFAALWLFRVVSAVALAAAASLAWRRLATLGVGAVGRWVFFGLLLADAKLADFAINGMETALLVFFTLLLWSELEAGAAARPTVLATAFAGLMWTRPDGFILAGAIALPHLFFRPERGGLARQPWRTWARGLAWGALAYLPWFVWAWWYYGSPIPHTIVAKAAVTVPFRLSELGLIPWRTLTANSPLMDLFLPTYWIYGGWPQWLPVFGWVLTVLAAFAWLLPRWPAAVRRVSLSVFVGMFYVCAVIWFPWYSPPWMALGALAIAGSCEHIAASATAAGKRRVVSLVRIVATIAVGFQAVLWVGTAWEMRVQQRVIEHGGRRAIGEWLHAHAAPTDTVFLEPLGYVGYYSRLKTFDYPGLSSPEVAALVRAGAWRFTEVIARLRPTWLVLRPFEIADPTRPENAAWRDYELVRVWDAHAELDAISFLPGRGWLERDAEFRVFRRKAGAPPSAKTP